TSAIAEYIVRVSLERNARIIPSHPHIESIVQEEIRQDRADNPTLRSSCHTRYDLPILHLYRGLQPALNIEEHPRTVRVLTDRFEEQLPIDAIEIGPDIDV